MFTIRFADLSFAEVAEQAKQRLLEPISDWEKDIWQFIITWADNNITEIEVYTSGSTGTPKPVKHNKQAMLASAQMTCETLNIPKGSNALLCLPATKIGGIMMIVRSIFNQMNLTCMQPTSTPFNSLPINHNINFAAFTPMQARSSDLSYEAFKKFEGIATVILGGETITESLTKHLKIANNSIYSTFGMTETISHIAIKKINGLLPDKNYKTLNGVSVAANADDCLIIDAPAISIHNLLTNDLVNIISPNEFSWLGRIDNVINTGGIKIYPEAIEQKLLPNMATPFFVIGMADDKTGQKPVLVIELESLNAYEMVELKEKIAQLNKHERPRTVYLIPEFARTGTGKINRKATIGRPAHIIAL